MHFFFISYQFTGKNNEHGFGMTSINASPYPELSDIKEGIEKKLEGCSVIILYFKELSESEYASMFPNEYARYLLTRKAEELHDGQWYWVRVEYPGETFETPAQYCAVTGCFYSRRFVGMPAREVTVLRPCA